MYVNMSCIDESAVRRYCEMQRGNKKTRAVLGRSFQHLGPAGDLFVERYMREVVFDHEFHYDIHDGVKAQLLIEHGRAGAAYVDMSAAEGPMGTMVSAMQEAENGDRSSEDDGTVDTTAEAVQEQSARSE
jgi:hypothetical protein